MFCPNCRGEFVEGFTYCKKCAVDLVETLPMVEKEKRINKDRISFDQVKGFIFDVEKMLKFGGWALLIIGVLFHASNATVNIFNAFQVNPVNKIGLLLELINIAFQMMSSIMWGLFYIALGYIIKLLKDRNM